MIVFKPNQLKSYYSFDSPILIKCLKTDRVVYYKPNVKGVKCVFNIPFDGLVYTDNLINECEKKIFSKLNPDLVLKLFKKENFFSLPEKIPSLHFFENKNKGTIYPLIHKIIIDKELKDTAPFAAVKFILFHELGHYFYKTEKYCDLFACACLYKLGYNTHDCLFVLGHILKRNDKNFERYKFCFNVLKKFKND